MIVAAAAKELTSHAIKIAAHNRSLSLVASWEAGREDGKVEHTKALQSRSDYYRSTNMLLYQEQKP